MPVNAGPEYAAAERKYEEAKSTSEKIKALEGMLRVAPNHKSSENLRAGLKTKISRLKQQIEKGKTSKKSGHTFAIKREGAAQAVICGLTNSGKSYLLSKLTNAKPIIADYEFATKMPELGIMDYHGIKIQAIEIPAITRDFTYKENGPMFFSIIRNSNLIIFLVRNNLEIDVLKEEFEKASIKLNKRKPNIIIKKEAANGINIIGSTKIPFSEIVNMCKDHSIYNATIEFHEDISAEEFADILDPSTMFMPMIIIRNKFKELNIDKLKEVIWQGLNLIKVYTKAPGKEKDYPPIALKQDSTIKDLAIFIHKDFLKKFKFARVWGSSKFPGQSLGMDYVLKDNDVIELHLK